ncbi:MAG: hypothetical protein PVH91_04515 [Pseudomonadales bacterium]
MAAVGARGATGEADVAQPPPGAQLVDSPLLRVPDYADKSDQELTRIGARWDDLNKVEKAALLREVKLRMAQRRDTDGVLVIRTQRRYGRVYNGSQYLKIETKVVRVTPADAAAAAAARKGFGVGFERRNAEGVVTGDSAGDDSDPSSSAAAQIKSPVIRVTDPS